MGGSVQTYAVLAILHEESFAAWTPKEWFHWDSLAFHALARRWYPGIPDERRKPLDIGEKIFTVRAVMRARKAMLLIGALLLLTGRGMGVHGALPKLERIEAFGHQYVYLGDWAEASKFELKWTRKDEEITLSSKWSKLVFTVNSKQVLVNGINVFLSVPIARRGQAALIAPQDLLSTLHPLLFPVRNTKGPKIQTVCLDPGHGGKDPGNQEGKTLEKKLVLQWAEELKKQLKEAGYKVVMTRTDDSFVDLPGRPEYAQKKDADLLISLHFNAAGESQVRGVETYCMTPAHASSTNARGEGANTGANPGNRQDEKNVHLAWQVQKALVKNLDLEDRGVRRARFAVLRYAEIPAILVEGGFMTNREEARLIQDPAWRTKLAKAVVEGVQAYKKAVER